MYKPLFGYTPNPAETEKFHQELFFKDRLSIATSLPWLLTQSRGNDTFLWQPLIKVKPSWRRGQQAIGDCVSWGHELVCTMLEAMQAISSGGSWEEEVATEAIYGLRVESDNQPSHEDGWYGSGAAKALVDYGCVLRIDYSKDNPYGKGTGNADHDMRIYSGQKAKDWGYYGCGGRSDNGKLDTITKIHPAKDVAKVSTVMEAAAALEHGCPISICSDVGFGEMRRDSDGIVRRSGSWGHCMMLGGVRYKNGEPQFRIFQSWGDSASGPDPGVEDRAINVCSWWAVAEDIEGILRQDDSYTFARIDGFKVNPWIWTPDHVLG